MSHLFTQTLVSARLSRFAQAFLLTAGLIVSSSLASASANPLAGSPLGFNHAPRLVDVTTTQLASFVSGGTYEFTLTVPPDAGAPLQAVKISQGKNATTIEFALAQSQAVANGIAIPIAAMGGTNSDDVVIAFDRPIQPGSTVKISLLVNRNSGSAGVYLFGVTAYPTGDATNGLFLGYGRVSLFSSGG